MARIKDLTNNRYGNLIVLKMNDERGPHNKVMCTCRCDCGNEIIVMSNSLQQGKVVSCGCKAKNVSHNMSSTRLYRIWNSMKSRCANPNRKDYHMYGGRGVTFCDEWNDFIPFYEWATSAGYADDLTLERIDVNGNYEPDNCKWITSTEQASNKTTTPYVLYNDNYITLKQLSEEIGINYQTLFGRYKRGERDEKLIRPIDPKKSTRRKNNA